MGKCEVCGGTGLKDEKERCLACGGYGSIERFQREKEHEEMELEIREEDKKSREFAHKLWEQKQETIEKIRVINRDKISNPTCCEDAKEYCNLKYCTGSYIDPNDCIVEKGWYLVYDSWTEYTSIKFCPFCGEELV